MSPSAQTPPNMRAVRIALRSMQTVGAIALLIALANSGYVLGYVWDCVRMQSWVAASATVTDATFAPQTPEFPPRVIVTFRYVHDGAEYTGHRADAAQGTYFTGDFIERQAAQLAEHAQDGTPTTCFVNSAEPAEAVLDRHFSPTVLAARLGILLLPILGGSLFFFAAGYVLRREAKMARAAKRFPGEPWLWREDWRTQRIFSATRSGAWMLYGFTGIYLAFALPLGLMVLDEQGFGMFGVAGIIMLIVGWGGLSLSAQRLFGRKRFDCAEFVMATPTGVIGGPLSGVAKLNSRLAGEGTFRASLECTYYLPGSGDSSGQEVVEWRDTILIDKPLASTDPFVIAVPIYFAIPYDVRECDLLSPRPVTWRLKVGLDGDEGVGYYARFEVPVFKTPESSPTFKADPQLLAGHEQRMSIDQVLKENGCRVETIAGGEAIRFSIYKQWALWGGLGIVAACGVGAWALIKYVHFGWAAIPGIFAAILVFGLCELLLWSSRIIIRPDGVTVTAGYPLVCRPRMLTTDEFGRFEGGVEFEMTERTWHCVWVIAADGKRWMVAKRIATRREADAIGDWLTEKARATLLPIE